MHSMFSSASKGPYVALAAASLLWPDGDQLTGPQLVQSGKSHNTEKEFLACPLMPLGKKPWFLPCDESKGQNIFFSSWFKGGAHVSLSTANVTNKKLTVQIDWKL